MKEALINPDRIRRIQAIVAARFGVTRAMLVGPRQPRSITQARNVAMAIARKAGLSKGYVSTILKRHREL